jgi:hypothetical protein
VIYRLLLHMGMSLKLTLTLVGACYVALGLAQTPDGAPDLKLAFL